jgi:predicted MFS family arabinose efflux permease
VFFLNVPIGIIAFLVGMRTVKESVSEEQRQLDIGGLILGTSALFLVTYGLIEANQLGWSDPRIVFALTGFVVLISAFLIWEFRSPKAMMPLRFFRIPAFSAGNTVAFSVSLGMFASFFFLSIYMQLIRGYSAFEAGVRFLPMTLMIIVTAPNAGKYAQKHGSRIPMTYGLILAGTGLLILSRLSLDTPYPVMAVIFVVMGHGMGATMAPMTAAVMNAVGPQRAGLGSAMTNTSREVGGVFGIALLGTILTTRLRAVFDPAIASLGIPASVRASIAEAAGRGTLDQRLLASLPASKQGAVFDAFREAFMSGYRLSLLVGGFVLLLAAVVANRFIPGRGPARVPEAEEPSAERAVQPTPALEF